MPLHLKRWFSNIFSSKKHVSVPEKTCVSPDHAVMSEKKIPPPRHHRKLPSIPPSSRQQQTYWPSYRVALEYIHKHKDIVDTALGLTELYPRLIQHPSCDRLWEFLTKVTFFDKEERKIPTRQTCMKGHNRTSSPSSRRKTKTKSLSVDSDEEIDNFVRETGSGQKGKSIPHISISHVGDEHSSIKDRGINLYICGNCSDDRWSRLVISIAEEYFIRCSSDDTDPSTCFQDIDLVIYLLDEHTTNPSSHYAHQLKAAFTHGLNVLYIRDSVSVFSDSSASHSFSNIPQLDITDHGFHSRASSSGLSTFDISQDESRSVSTGNLHTHFSTQSSYLSETRNYQSTKLSIPGTPIRCQSPISADRRATGLDATRRLLDANTRSQSASSNVTLTSPLKPHNSHFTVKPKIANPLLDRFTDENDRERYNIDLPRELQQSVRSASLYDKRRHAEGVRNVLTAIGSRRSSHPVDHTGHANFYQDKTFLETPASDMFSSKDSAIGDMFIAAHDDIQYIPNENEEESPDEVMAAEKAISTSPSPETVFVVYESGDNMNRHVPRIVHYNERSPVDLSNSSSIDSLGFQDIDLSRFVNELDLFSRPQDSDYE